MATVRAIWIVLLCFTINFVCCDRFTDFKAQFWSPWVTKPLETNSTTIVPDTDVRAPNRRIWIITTACLPWMTGTSINPLLRAAYFAKKSPKGHVHLIVPWLKREDQEIAFPPGVRFNTPDEQRRYVQDWLINDAHLPAAAENLDILFYAASYHDEYHSIFPMGDIAALVPDADADFCILEEPEHLNWYKAPFTAKAWMEKFKHVVGIIHTNYLSYTRAHTFGQIKEPLVYYVNQAVCRAYCHKIIKLSSALQEFAVEKEITCNVHGVRTKYLSIGDYATPSSFTKGAYFVGKMAWPKGLGELFTLMDYVKTRTGRHFPVDIYGQGPHLRAIQEEAARRDLPVTFFGAVDHALLTDYQVFVNPSLSEVLCTTIVEALAMGKWVVCAKHPSNEFFEQFPNCLTFRNEEEFAANVFWALNNPPQMLTREQRYTLSWDAAMERFEAAATLTVEEQRRSKSYSDQVIAWIIETLGSGKHGDAMRLLAGGGSAANQIEYTNKYGSALPVFFTGMPLSPSPPVGEKEQSSAAGTLGGDGERDEVGRAQERCDVADSLATPRF